MRTRHSIIICIMMAALIFSACSSLKPPQRYYYDYSKKKLSADDTGKKEEMRPIPYRSSKDIQLEIYNYNPLRDEIIVEDSSSPRTLGDTASLARLIVFPQISDLAEGNAQNREIARKNGGTGATEAFGFQS